MAWTTPATWVNGAVTAAEMNTEVRDHAVWLKGFADLITNSTAADTGTATYLSVARAATEVAIRTVVAGESYARMQILASGKLYLQSTGLAAPTTYLSGGGSGRLMLSDDTAGSPVIRFRLTSDTEHRVIGIEASTDTDARIALGLQTTTGYPMISWGPGDASPDLFLTRDAAGRIVASATSDHARIGAICADASEAASHFAWRTGDTIPRISIGQDANGLPALRFSPGSGVAYESIYRENTAALGVTASVNVYRDAAASSYLRGAVVGDTGPRVRVSSTAGGYGAIYIDDGTSAAGSETINLYGNADNDLRTDDHFYAAELAVPVKAGTPSDSDTTIDMSGNCILDTTNSRIYFRVGSTWKYAALT